MRSLLLLGFILTMTFSVNASSDWRHFPAVAERLGNQSPTEAGIDLNIPLVIDDGSSVNLKVSFNGSLANEEYLSRLWILADKNPNPDVIDFELSQAIPKLELTTRIRLGESQTVYALAQSNQGNFWLTSKDVRVTVSGCLMGNEEPQADIAMTQPRVALPRNPTPGNAAELRTMINHPMETGFREDGQGGYIPQQLVKSLNVTQAGNPVIDINFHTGTSANPFVAFFTDQFSDLTFTWTDQHGAQVTETR